MTRPAHARSNGPTGASDAPRDDVLLDAAHSGDADAFGALRERYHGTALAVARSRTGSAEEAESTAATALGRIEQIVGEGGGPRAFLGAFVVWMVGREADGGTRPVALPDDPADPTSLVRVFSGLPAEWQAFLWRTEVLGHSARRAAAALGLGAVAAAGLHRDMVRGLRGLYSQAAADRAAGPDCAEFSGELSHFVRGTRGQRSRRDVKTHLDGCARCTAEYLGRQDIGTGLRTWTLPVLAGLPLWGTEALELSKLIAGAGAGAGADAGTGAAAGAGAGTGAAAGAAAGVVAVGAGAGASGARPDGAAGTSPWSGRRAKFLRGAGALATPVAVAAVGVSGGDDPVPAAGSLAVEQAPRTAEDLENPRADDPAAGAEQTDDDNASGAGTSASERDRGSSRTDDTAAEQDPVDTPAGARQGGTGQGGAGREAAALVADADRSGADRSGDDAGGAAAGAGGASAGAPGSSGGDGSTRPGSGSERPASNPDGTRAAEAGTPGAASAGGAARDTSSGGSSTSVPPARKADAPSPVPSTNPSPARKADTPSPTPSVGKSLLPGGASPAPLRAPVPPARTAGPPSDAARPGPAPGAGRQHADEGAGAPGVRNTDRGPRERSWSGKREQSWRGDGAELRKDAGRHDRDHNRGKDGRTGRPGNSDHPGEGHTHR